MNIFKPWSKFPHIISHKLIQLFMHWLNPIFILESFFYPFWLKLSKVAMVCYIIGQKDVKDSKLQRLTTSFEEIKMEEDESFDEFYIKLKGIVNSAFNFGETIPEPKIMRKVLRSLLERFHAKITAIEESKDIDKIPLTELVGNLQTYELGLTRIGKSGKSKSKSMALKAKSNNTYEFLDDEDSKMKSYITR